MASWSCRPPPIPRAHTGPAWLSRAGAALAPDGSAISVVQQRADGERLAGSWEQRDGTEHSWESRVWGCLRGALFCAGLCAPSSARMDIQRSPKRSQPGIESEQDVKITANVMQSRNQITGNETTSREQKLPGKGWEPRGCK